MKTLIIALLIIIGAVVRLIGLEAYPNGFTADEAQQGYTAYSLLKTGRDEWGDLLPIFPRGFGDYKAPLYSYLAIPSVAIFGLNEFAVRLPAALIGVLTLIVCYFLAKRLFDQKIALIALFLLTINPWHVQLSRTAFEGGAGVLLFSAGVLAYLAGKTNRKLWILASVLFGLAIYSYHSWRVFILVFLAVLGVYEIRQKLNLKQIVLPLVILLIFLAPIILNLDKSLKRSNDVSIFSEKRLEGYFKSKTGTDLPPHIARVIDNKVSYLSGLFFSQYISYFSPTFFFTDSRSDSNYLNFPFHVLFYQIELLFIFIGLYLIYTKKFPNRFLIFTWILLAPIPAAIVNGGNANRAITFLPILSIVSAYGFYNLYLYLVKQKYSLLRAAPILMILLLLFSFATFIYDYLYKIPQKPAYNLRFGYKETFDKVFELDRQNDYDVIVFSRAFSMPQIFIAFYQKIDPAVYQAASQDWLRYEKADKLYVDQLESYNLGKYEFKDIDWNRDKNKEKDLLIGGADNFPETFPAKWDVKYPNGTILYRIIETPGEEKKDVQK